MKITKEQIEAEAKKQYNSELGGFLANEVAKARQNAFVKGANFVLESHLENQDKDDEPIDDRWPEGRNHPWSLPRQ